MIAIGNFSDHMLETRLHINWDQIGMKPQGILLRAPGIEDFQDGLQFKITDPIRIQPRKGYLLYLERIK